MSNETAGSQLRGFFKLINCRINLTGQRMGDAEKNPSLCEAWRQRNALRKRRHRKSRVPLLEFCHALLKILQGIGRENVAFARAQLLWELQQPF